MCHVDFLSRNPLPIENNKTINKVPQKRIYAADITTNWLLAEQQRDEEIASIVSKIQNNELDQELLSTFELRSGLLYRQKQRHGRTRCLVMIPRAFRWSIINLVHESLVHLEWEKT